MWNRRIEAVVRFLAPPGRPRIHFLHIRKTGGTAIKKALADNTKRGKYEIVLHKHNVKFNDVPRGERVVFFLRDPVSRFVSGFNSRKRQGMPRYYMPWNPGEAVAFGRFETANELALALASLDKTARDAAEFAMRSIKHVNSSYWDWFGGEAYFLSRMQDIFFVGFQESLDTDFARLRSLLGLPDVIVLPSNEVEAHRGPQDAPKKLDDEAIEAIRAWYQADYEFIRICRQKLPNAVVAG